MLSEALIMIATMTKTRLWPFILRSSLLVWWLYAIVTKPCTCYDRSSCWSTVDGQHPPGRSTLAPNSGDGSIGTVSPLNFIQLERCSDWNPSLKGFDLVVLVNLTGTITSPTQTVLSAKAGHIQINLTLLNLIEPTDCQAIDATTHSINCEIAIWCSSCCAGVFGSQRRVGQS
ncbi:hypothetical protein EDB87DRAFT_723985 [Lactarius vividus]|nr:hypothetical protein EDB87DRAFT_723985 [Lactarius vividus]